MTSANITNYTITDLQGNKVGKHSQHCYCKTHWGDLLVFMPPENFMIQTWGLDEEEELWENKPINLKIFIDKLKANKHNFKTFQEITKKQLTLAKENPSIET